MLKGILQSGKHNLHTFFTIVQPSVVLMIIYRGHKSILIRDDKQWRCTLNNDINILFYTHDIEIYFKLNEKSKRT